MNKITATQAPVQHSCALPLGAPITGTASGDSPALSGAPAAMLRPRGCDPGPVAPGFYFLPSGRLVDVVGTLANDQVVYVRHDGTRGAISGSLARKVMRPMQPFRASRELRLERLRRRAMIDTASDGEWMDGQPTGAVVGLCTLFAAMLLIAALIGLIALAVL